MNNLLGIKPEKKGDGFDVDSYIVLVSHPYPDLMPPMGTVYQVDEEAQDAKDVNVNDDRAKTMDYYGQPVSRRLPDGQWASAFFALSWMRPATDEEIEEAGGPW